MLIKIYSFYSSKAVNCLELLGEHYFASGSDNGTVKVGFKLNLLSAKGYLKG